MTPDDREFGILIGKVEALGEQIAEMRRSNSKEHASVIQRLDGLQGALNRKVDWLWMREQKIPDRLGSLEATRDEGRGAAKLLRVGQGAIVLALMFLTYVATKGGI